MLAYAIISSIVFCCIIGFLIYILIRKNREHYDDLYDMKKHNEIAIDDIRKRYQYQIETLNSKNRETNKLLLQEEAKSTALQNKISSTKCLICGEPSNAKHFCFNCYTKYKDRSIDIRIIHCLDTEILDYYGNKTFVCDDGRMVRSRAEALISNFLFNNNIRYVYEKPYHFLEKGISKTLHPDFYLPDFNLYIEYNELNTESYTQGKDYALKIYQKENLNVLVMTNKELYDISNFLIPKLKSINPANKF